MNAREIFKDVPPKGQVLLCTTGGHRGADTFAYRICDDGVQFNVSVISAVNPREYSVRYGHEVNVDTLENAILYNEWHARRLALMKEESGVRLEDVLAGAHARSSETISAGSCDIEVEL